MFFYARRVWKTFSRTFRMESKTKLKKKKHSHRRRTLNLGAVVHVLVWKANVSSQRVCPNKTHAKKHSAC